MRPNILFVRAVLAVVCVLAGAATTAAQTAGYVGGSVFADVRLFGSSSGVPYYGDQFSLDTTGVGGGLRVGTFLHPRWSLELAADTSSRATVDLNDTVRILVALPTPLNFRASARFVTVATTVGFHQHAAGRVKLGYRAGFSFVRATYTSDYPSFVLPAEIFTRAGSGPAFPTILPPPQFTTRTITQSHNAGALVLGFESAIDLTRRVAVTPEVRAFLFSAPYNGPGIFLIRPGVAVKWNF
jgi:hypothetical protein